MTFRVFKAAVVNCHIVTPAKQWRIHLEWVLSKIWVNLRSSIIDIECCAATPFSLPWPNTGKESFGVTMTSTMLVLLRCAVLPVQPKYWLGHPENYLHSSSKKIFSGSNFQMFELTLKKEALAVCMNYTITSAFLAEISVSSPRKIFIFIIWKNIFWIKVPKKYVI